MTEEQRYTEIMLAFEKLHKRIDDLEEKFKNINSTILDINHRNSKVDPSYLQLPEFWRNNRNSGGTINLGEITAPPCYKTEGEVEYKYEPIVKTEWL